MKMNQNFIIIICQGFHQKGVEFLVVPEQVLESIRGEAVESTGRFCDDGKFLGAFLVRSGDQLVEADDPPGIKIEIDRLLPPVGDAGEGADAFLQEIKISGRLTAVLDV